MEKIIDWNENWSPTSDSLRRLSESLKTSDIEKAIRAFYAAIKENHYPNFFGPERREVRGEEIDVWAYHTGGWSGNEEIIAVLKESWLFDWLLERYDSGGHYYFKPMEKVLKEGN